ncbi:hypothetical protein N7540_011139 [Penicillium herquei]|nr:hypothetical protein N7540_011139 [Penicillium herquei]
MRLFLILSTFCCAALAGTFEIFDVNGLCYIYADRVWGCTGSSQPIGHLSGTSCANLSVHENDSWVRRDAVNVTACDSDHGQAYILADRNGLLLFRNTDGNTANCTVGADVHVGSICTALDDDGLAHRTPAASPTGKPPTKTPQPSQSFAASMETVVQASPTSATTTSASNFTAPQTPDSTQTETGTTDC